MYYCNSTSIQRGDFLAWSFSNSSPVYLQIAERIIISILAGEYLAGQQLPTVRQLALSAAVNPNTVQHAYTYLETEGIIISKGTLGRFVTEDDKQLEIGRKHLAEKIVKEFMCKLDSLAITKAEAIKLIKEVEL